MVQGRIKTSPTLTAVELPGSEPTRPEVDLARRAQPGAWEPPNPKRSARLRRIAEGRADPRVQAALANAAGDLPPGDGYHGSPDVFWVSDGLGAAAALPLTPGIELIDLAAIQVGEQRLVATERAASGCVLDGVLEQADDPGALLAWAYRHLRPGGRLALTVTDTRSRRALKPGDPTAVDPDGTHPFPGETLQAHLFREGFEEPRLRRVGPAVVVSARRSALPPPPQRSQRLSVIMPVYNEAATFETTAALVLAKEIPGVEIDVVMVESNSTDGSREKVLRYSEHPRVQVILEDRPLGKGHAVRAGLEAARGDFVLIQDADLEYDVDDYDVLLEPLRACEIGFVLGMRTNPDGSWGMRQFGQRGWTSHIMNLGHEVFLTLFNVVYGQRLRDPFTMYKVVRRDCLYGLSFESNRFDFDWELAAKLVRAGYHPREIPVTYRSRSFHEGKKVTMIRDPITWIRACFKYRFVKLYPDS